MRTVPVKQRDYLGLSAQAAFTFWAVKYLAKCSENIVVKGLLPRLGHVPTSSNRYP